MYKHIERITGKRELSIRLRQKTVELSKQETDKLKQSPKHKPPWPVHGLTKKENKK